MLAALIAPLTLHAEAQKRRWLKFTSAVKGGRAARGYAAEGRTTDCSRIAAETNRAARATDIDRRRQSRAAIAACDQAEVGTRVAARLRARVLAQDPAPLLARWGGRVDEGYRSKNPCARVVGQG